MKSLCSQLSFTHGLNRKASRPFTSILITSLDGRTKAHLDGIKGKDYLRWRGVDWWTGGYQCLWEDSDPGAISLKEVDPSLQSASDGPRKRFGKVKPPTKHACDRSAVVYLTADAEDELMELEEGTTYIIGGIVDRNRYKVCCSH